MTKKLIGRTEEIHVLQAALKSDEAEMIAVVGRRRVGKTFLISTVYAEQIAFEVSGLTDGNKQVQLENFYLQLTKFAPSNFEIQKPKTWLEAFFILTQLLEQKIAKQNDKPVIFLDELPWMASPKSGFLQGLSYFWNSWAVKKKVVVVVCGSAASWMIQKVVNNKGGLYNRLTQRVYLKPFTLAETEAYLQSRNFKFDRYHIVLMYMAMGGIPHYLKEIKRGKSAVQNINQICFSETGLLRDEFKRLYPSLFSNAEKHSAVIRALATKRMGLVRKDIAQISKVAEGGSLKKVLEELLHSGFIAEFRQFGKNKKEKTYRLTDEYSLFYLQFIEGKTYEDEDVWKHQSQTQSFKAWSGYSFESICLKHIAQIKKALGISGIYSLSSSFYRRGNEQSEGAQIDLLIDRNDNFINLCELKFANDIFTLTKLDVQNLQTKERVFRAETKTKKMISWALIAPFGFTKNQYALDFIDHELTLDALFEK